jgi:hypothetical protein
VLDLMAALEASLQRAGRSDEGDEELPPAADAPKKKAAKATKKRTRKSA